MKTANDGDKEYPTLVRLECGSLKKISTLVCPTGRVVVLFCLKEEKKS